MFAPKRDLKLIDGPQEGHYFNGHGLRSEDLLANRTPDYLKPKELSLS